MKKFVSSGCFAWIIYLLFALFLWRKEASHIPYRSINTKVLFGGKVRFEWCLESHDDYYCLVRKFKQGA